MSASEKGPNQYPKKGKSIKFYVDNKLTEIYWKSNEKNIRILYRNTIKHSRGSFFSVAFLLVFIFHANPDRHSLAALKMQTKYINECLYQMKINKWIQRNCLEMMNEKRNSCTCQEIVSKAFWIKFFFFSRSPIGHYLVYLYLAFVRPMFFHSSLFAAYIFWFLRLNIDET